LLPIVATVGILKRVTFKFIPGVRRGLNGYT
jgi:hypothetical protein